MSAENPTPAPPVSSAPKPVYTPKPGDKGTKRSWKNLLINKRYQLQFTLFMVGLAALLMLGLGWRVMSKTNEATTVTKNQVLGDLVACPPIPTLNSPVAPDEAKDEDESPKPDVDAAGSAAPTATGSGSAAGTVDAAADELALADVTATWCKVENDDTTCVTPPQIGKELLVKAPVDCDGVVDFKLGDAEALEPLHKAKIKSIACEGGTKRDVPKKARRAKPTIHESSIKMTFTLPPDYSDAIAAHYTCEIPLWTKLQKLNAGKLKILLILIGSGVVLLVGLAVYGIKMTHKVAGPLFKVSLYLGKMRDGRLDKVYNLRKGDQLVSFYEHFKAGHAGVVQLEKDDIVQLKAVIAAAETAGAGDHATIAELRTILARKEKSIE